MITQREAALSYRTLPKKYDCNIFEQKAIEGLVFKNLSLSGFTYHDRDCKPLQFCKIQCCRCLRCERHAWWKVFDIYGWCIISWLQLTVGCCCWIYPVMIRRPIWAISFSSVFPGLPGVLCQAFNLSSRFTTPSKICNRTTTSVNKELKTKPRPVSTPCSVYKNPKPFSTAWL